MLSRQQRSVQWCGYLHLDNEPPSCLQHRKSGDQYKMQYIVSMFILIRSFNHQSSALHRTLLVQPQFDLYFYPPALSVVAEAARWRYGGGRLPALITRRLEAGGRIPVRNIPRNLPRPAEVAATCRDFATCRVPSSCRWSAAAGGVVR